MYLSLSLCNIFSELKIVLVSSCSIALERTDFIKQWEPKEAKGNILQVRKNSSMYTVANYYSHCTCNDTYRYMRSESNRLFCRFRYPAFNYSEREYRSLLVSSSSLRRHMDITFKTLKYADFYETYTDIAYTEKVSQTDR